MSDNSNNSTRTLSSTQTKADGDENTEKQHVGREFRWHALLDQWVIVAASTSDRPWNGNRATTVQTTSVRHDPDCYLCPNVTRSSGTENPAYQGTYAFDNDYPSLIGSVEMGRDKPSQENFAYDATSASNKLHHSLPSTGACRVLCWNDRHDLTLATLNSDDMLSVARLWRDEFTMLKKRQDIAQVLIFENKGLETGVSNLHPHGQYPIQQYVCERHRPTMRTSIKHLCYNNCCNAPNITKTQHTLYWSRMESGSKPSSPILHDFPTKPGSCQNNMHVLLMH